MNYIVVKAKQIRLRPVDSTKRDEVFVFVCENVCLSNSTFLAYFPWCAWLGKL